MLQPFCVVIPVRTSRQSSSFYFTRINTLPWERCTVFLSAPNAKANGKVLGYIGSPGLETSTMARSARTATSCVSRTEWRRPNVPAAEKWRNLAIVTKTRHNDPSKSHRSDLCEKCRSGRHCERN